jgi:hypothetical protein
MFFFSWEQIIFAELRKTTSTFEGLLDESSLPFLPRMGIKGAVFSLGASVQRTAWACFPHPLLF